MQAALAPFQEAHATALAQPVASFFSPVPPAHDPGRLYDFFRASNEVQIEGDVRYVLKHNKTTKMTQKESGAWVDIIVSYIGCLVCGWLWHCCNAEKQGRGIGYCRRRARRPMGGLLTRAVALCSKIFAVRAVLPFIRTETHGLRV